MSEISVAMEFTNLEEIKSQVANNLANHNTYRENLASNLFIKVIGYDGYE